MGIALIREVKDFTDYELDFYIDLYEFSNVNPSEYDIEYYMELINEYWFRIYSGVIK